MSPRAESPFGLLQLYPEGGATPQRTGVDIVAIHGLGGHRISSWSSEDGNMWLKDQLPQSNGVADLNPRISTFGYDAEVAFTASRETLAEYALQLLSLLHAQRVKTRTTDVPLVFICHSLGGIVGKKALILAHQNPSKFGDLQRCLRGFVFIGTPHLGAADKTVWLKRLLTMGKIITGGRVRDDLHKLLLPKDAELSAISLQSAGLLSALRVVSMYETLRKGNLLAVERASASSAGQFLIPIDRDHVNICKYSRAEEIAYQMFSMPVIQLLRGVAQT